MARDRTGSRTGDPDDATPAWVSEPQQKIPRCVSCGRDVPAARQLYTLCRVCQDPAPSKKLVLRHPQGTHALIGDVAQKLGWTQGIVEDAKGNVLVGPALAHYDNLRKRGLSDASARRLAESLVIDAAHRALCMVCGGSSRKTPRKLPE